MRTILLAGAAIAAVAATIAIAAPAAVPDASARLFGADGKPMGVVLFHQTPKGVQIDINASSLTAGVHAVHIHAVGKCEGAAQFKSAGGHFDVGGHAHGKLDPHGPHTGDMDNQTVNKLGFMRVTFTDASITLGVGPTSLFDADGSSIVIHAGPDDYKTQPAGGSGDRIACGVIKAMP
jgi:Cu-Zn family superoxide dismutase